MIYRATGRRYDAQGRPIFRQHPRSGIPRCSAARGATLPYRRDCPSPSGLGNDSLPLSSEVRTAERGSNRQLTKSPKGAEGMEMRLVLAAICLLLVTPIAGSFWYVDDCFSLTICLLVTTLLLVQTYRRVTQVQADSIVAERGSKGTGTAASFAARRTAVRLLITRNSCASRAIHDATVSTFQT